MNDHEFLRQVARAHVNKEGHKIALVKGVGWLCAVCDEDFEEFIQEHPDFEMIQGE